MPKCEFCRREFLTYRGLEELHSKEACLSNQLSAAKDRIMDLEEALKKEVDIADAANKRLAEVEGLLSRISADVETLDYCPFCSGELDEDYNLQHDDDCPIKAFLTPTSQAPELCEVACSSCGNLYSTTCTMRPKPVAPSPDMVMVRKADLKWVEDCRDYGSDKWEDINLRREAIARLKAAIEGGKHHE